MALEPIRPKDLPAAATVFPDASIPGDNGATVERYTPTQIVDAVAPVASEAEALAGVNNTKRMTPLTTKQAYDAALAAGVNVYASRAAFEAASPPLVLAQWAVLDGDQLLFYVADVAGTAIESANGIKGSPDAAGMIWLEHWGVIPASTFAGATVDYTTQVQAALTWTQGTLNFSGWVKITGKVTANNNCTVRCSRGRTGGGFAIRTDWAEPLATGCFVPGTSETAGSMVDFGMKAEQPGAPINRAALFQYPPAIDISNLPRGSFQSVRITEFNNGIYGFGNFGGFRFSRMEYGNFTINANLDGALDFVQAHDIEVYPFGFAGNPYKTAIFYDGDGYALKLGRVDNWTCSNFSVYGQKIDLSDTGGTARLPYVFNGIGLDGDGARLILGAGDSLITNLYSVKTNLPTLADIVVTAGRHSITNGSISGAPAVSIEVTGGELNYEGRLHNSDNAKKGAVVSGGELNITNSTLEWTDAARSVPFIQQSGAGILRVRECVPGFYTNPGLVVEIGNLVQGTDIDVSRLVPHTVTFGTFPTIGDDAVVHVSRFGAKGDGVTDDRIAIQAANDYVAANGGGRILFSPRAYLVTGPLARSPKVRWVGQGPTQFLEPTNLGTGGSGTVTDYMALLGTKIVASRAVAWGTRRGVVECINPTAFLWLDSGMENIVIYANEIAECANPCAGLSGGNYSRVIAGWSRLADWPMGPGVGGEKVPFTQAMLDNCAVISTGRIYAGSAAAYIGGMVFWGDDRRTVPDGIEIFSNANQITMIGCFGRVPTGQAFVYEDSDDIKATGITGPVRFASVDTIVYGTKSALTSNNFCGRHHVIEGYQGTFTADAATTTGGRAASSNHVLLSSGNGVTINMPTNQKKVPAQALAGNVINGATTTLPYPAGTVQADYVASHISLSGSVFIDAVEYTVEKAITPQVAVTFDASVITITNNTGVTWTAGQMISLSRIYTLWDLPRVTFVRTGNNGGLTENGGGTYGAFPVGCLLNRNAVQSIPNGTNTMLAWTTAQWQNGPANFWNVSDPTKIIVPAGISYMQFSAGATFAASAVGRRELHIIKNQYGMVGMGKVQTTGTLGGTNLQVNSAVVEVKEGDFIEIRVYQDSGGALDVTQNESTWGQCIAW